MRRLGKQRVEAYQILKIVSASPEIRRTMAWHNHPAVKIWELSPGTLCRYAICMCDEWISRGYKDTTREKIVEILLDEQSKGNSFELIFEDRPFWLGDPRFHASHRAALLAKKPEWYQQFGWSEEPKIDYFWPVPTKVWQQRERIFRWAPWSI